MTIFAIHQPNYIPYLGYFYKMARSDVFVYLDAVQYPRGRSFASRNRIRTPSGAQYLTIPVRIPKGREGKVSYLEVEYADDNWREKHLKSIQMNYARSPYFSEVFSMYESTLSRHEVFAETNIALIEVFADYLGIKTRRLRLSQILPSFGRKTQLICDIGSHIRADVYLSGTGGGSEYTDEKLLADHGITLVYSDFSHPEYKQLFPGFIGHLSILDVLFNVGRDASKFL